MSNLLIRGRTKKAITAFPGTVDTHCGEHLNKNISLKLYEHKKKNLKSKSTQEGRAGGRVAGRNVQIKSTKQSLVEKQPPIPTLAHVQLCAEHVQGPAIPHICVIK